MYNKCVSHCQTWKEGERGTKAKKTFQNLTITLIYVSYDIYNWSNLQTKWKGNKKAEKKEGKIERWRKP